MLQKLECKCGDFEVDALHIILTPHAYMFSVQFCEVKCYK